MTNTPIRFFLLALLLFVALFCAVACNSSGVPAVPDLGAAQIDGAIELVVVSGGTAASIGASFQASSGVLAGSILPGLGCTLGPLPNSSVTPTLDVGTVTVSSGSAPAIAMSIGTNHSYSSTVPSGQVAYGGAYDVTLSGAGSVPAITFAKGLRIPDDLGLRDSYFITVDNPVTWTPGGADDVVVTFVVGSSIAGVCIVGDYGTFTPPADFVAGLPQSGGVMIFEATDLTFELGPVGSEATAFLGVIRSVRPYTFAAPTPSPTPND